MVWWAFVIAEIVIVTDEPFVFYAHINKTIIEPMYDNAAAAGKPFQNLSGAKKGT